ncbi:helix-turn-helix transcriptional regulator [Pararhizobium sp.]|uniref:helix-turn-helix transcriptional regulator n=1 Tax=Pararhizobium sp. TaxID=1977563 RepID=UPI0027161921|nr:LuxR C-terminal-related transcriptional regulator [Pararhizobium sp.]MDO9415661.1 LuxR C-terminal-related transcriptional regulator [Pararhizobium sp.]
MTATKAIWTRPTDGDFAPEIAALATQFDVIRFMKGTTAAFGFKTFLVFNMPIVTSEKLSTNSIISNIAVELFQKYDELGLLKHSDSIRKLRQTTAPFHYTLDQWFKALKSVPGTEPVEQYLRDNNLLEAYFFPVHDADANRGAVIWSGDRSNVTMSEIMELQMIAIHVYNRLAEIGAMLKTGSVSLSEREKHCLSWTAAGKTSSEIAHILGLSEHTINHYLNQATRKLDAVNRTQAVVKAMKRGFIS